VEGDARRRNEDGCRKLSAETPEYADPAKRICIERFIAHALSGWSVTRRKRIRKDGSTANRRAMPNAKSPVSFR
jgi:hypothetical protein